MRIRPTTANGHTHRRTTGLVFSASTMSQKIGWAFGAFFALRLLDWVGFEANVVPSLGHRHEPFAHSGNTVDLTTVKLRD